jgi:hypothetical protein
MERLAMWSMVVGILTACVMVAFAAGRAEAADEQEPMLSHDVYFTLNDNSPAAKEKLIAACKKYLADHPGTVWFAAGPRAEEFQRDVNDRDYDVALHLVFKNKAAHDQYAVHARHLQFIEENKDNWKKVRVFDSYVGPFSHGDVPMPKAVKTPKPAKKKAKE